MNYIKRHNDPKTEIEVQAFISRVLGRLISKEEFEEEVNVKWSKNEFLSHAPVYIQTINHLIKYLDYRHNSTYGADVKNAEFYSKWLTAEDNIPGAIYIDAPPEKIALEESTNQFNREIHTHDSARAALITKGNPIFHFRKYDQENNMTQYMLALKPGDFIVWPKNIPHTFNAMDGFSLLSIMESYIVPDDDGFSYPVLDNDIEKEKLNIQKLSIK